jgi:flagellar biosynthetic protein FlhB
MAEGNEDDSQKTEQPTQKRLEDARKKGQVVTSREINNFFILCVLAIVLMMLAKPMMQHITKQLFPLLERPHDYLADGASLLQMITDLLLQVGLILMIPVLLAVVAALAAGGLQTQLNVSLERIKPKWEKISILKGVKRLFSMRNFVEFLKGILKISIVCILVYFVTKPYFNHLQVLPHYEISEMLRFTDELTRRIFVAVLSVLMIVAALDYGYQRFEYMKNLRMSKQDMKDEYKQQEGDPHIKSKLKQIRSEKARKRMMANVPTADVIITNPTHYAIALKYDSTSMQAPMVVAKGKDGVAQRIKAIAEDNKIPIFRNPPVARALFDHAELDAEIPLEYYSAVAKIIGYVYRMQGKLPKRTAKK